jgi:hypothetical protein
MSRRRSGHAGRAVVSLALIASLGAGLGCRRRLVRRAHVASAAANLADAATDTTHATDDGAASDAASDGDDGGDAFDAEGGPLDERDFEPPAACALPIAPGTALTTLGDLDIAAAVVRGVDRAERTFPPAENPDDAGEKSEWSASDCYGHRYRFAALDPEATTPQRRDVIYGAHLARAEEFPSAIDTEVITPGPLHVQRSAPLGRKLAVNVVVGVTHGYDDTCFGYVALLRIDRDRLLVEASTKALGCAAPTLAHLDGGLVLVEPSPPSNSGEEEATVDGDFRVLAPVRGALDALGVLPAFHSWGNGARGRFYSFYSEVIDPSGPTLRLREHWTAEDRDDPEAVREEGEWIRTAHLVETGGKRRLTIEPSGRPKLTAVTPVRR